MRKHIPNIVTLLAASSGILAVAMAFQQQLHWAAYFILLAAVFDFADGFLARLLNAKSALGADLDSLSDVVSFGVAPSAIAFQLLNDTLPENLKLLAYFAFIIVPFSVLRLAIFNNSTNQTSSFVGIPVPAHAMLWVGLVFLRGIPYEWINLFLHPFALLAYALLFSLLLVSKLPLFALKFTKEKQPHKDKALWIFFVIALVLLALLQLGGLFFIIMLYVLSGFVNFITKKSSSI